MAPSHLSHKSVSELLMPLLMLYPSVFHKSLFYYLPLLPILQQTNMWAGRKMPCHLWSRESNEEVTNFQNFQEGKLNQNLIIPSCSAQSHQDFLHLYFLLTARDLRLLTLHEISAHAADRQCYAAPFLKQENRMALRSTWLLYIWNIK